MGDDAGARDPRRLGDIKVRLWAVALNTSIEEDVRPPAERDREALLGIAMYHQFDCQKNLTTLMIVWGVGINSDFSMSFHWGFHCVSPPVAVHDP